MNDLDEIEKNADAHAAHLSLGFSSSRKEAVVFLRIQVPMLVEEIRQLRAELREYKLHTKILELEEADDERPCL